jgi:hypothetical protein
MGIMGNLKSLADKAISGKIPTKFKTMVNMRSGVPNARPAFLGEKHPISYVKNRQGKKTVVFNNYLGPNTNVSARLLRGDKPVGRSDKAGYAHDLRHALWTTPQALRKSDRMFISKLKSFERSGEPKINTQVGIRGIQLKNKLMDKGIWSHSKFLNPMKDDDPAKPIARRELARLEQEGYGAVGLAGGIIPGAMLKKKILGQMKKTGKAVVKSLPKDVKIRLPKGLPVEGGITIKPRDLAKLTVERIVPGLIRKIAQKVKRRPRMFGKGVKHTLVRDFTNYYTKQFGGAISLATLAALAPIGISAATTLTPLAIKLGKKIVPKIISLFRRRKRGRGFGDLLDKMGDYDPRVLFGKAVFKIVGPMFKRIIKQDFPNIARMFGMGIKDLVGKAARKVIPYAEKGLKGIQKGVQYVKKEIKSPKDVARVLLNQALPALVGMIRKKTGIQPRKMGSGIKNKMEKHLMKLIRARMRKMRGGAIGIGTLLGLAGTAAPIVIPLVAKAAKFLLPKIIGLFKRKRGKGVGLAGGAFLDTIGKLGKAAKPLIDLLKPILMKVLGKIGKNIKLGKMMGFGIGSFIKNIGKKFASAVKMVLSPEFRKGFAKGFMGVMKPAGEIAMPIIKEAGPILVKQGLPLLLKMLAKSG